MSEEDPRITAKPAGSDLQEEYMKSFQPLEEGQMIESTVVELGEEYVFVDVGYKSEGKIPVSEFDTIPKIGDMVYVVLLRKESRQGEVIVSKQQADEKLFWRDLRKAQGQRISITGKIVKSIKGGFDVDLGRGMRAFLPLSKTDVNRVENPEDFVGLESPFYVERLYSRGKVNIVVSRRDWLEDEIATKKQEFFETVKIGQVIEGVVKSFTSFGAFIDLGGFDGLLHINDMSWRHVTSPREVVEMGQQMQFKVIRVEPEEQRINLSLKHFTEDPWNHFEEKYQIEDVVKGRVTKLADFGAFIELEEGIEGLAHISELSWVRKIRHPKEVLKIGDSVEVKILSYNAQEGKISLGLKQVLPNPWDDIEQRFPVGMQIRRPVKNLANFGAFFEIEEGIDGLLHVDDMSWTKKVRHPSAVLKEGEEVDVMVIEIDKENQKIKLGMKQLSEDPWKYLAKAFPRGSIIEGEITNITDFGLFVRVQGDVEGLVHKGNLHEGDAESTEEVLSRYKVGEKVKAVVIEASASKQKLSLSIKDYVKKLQQEEMVKYIHDDSAGETVVLSEFIRDKTQG